MSQLIPSWLDLWNVAFWVTAVLAVAVILGGLWAVIDTVCSYGLPKFRKALDEPVTLRIAKPARPWSEPSAKGFSRIPSVTDIEDGRRRRELQAAYQGGSRRIH